MLMEKEWKLSVFIIIPLVFILQPNDHDHGTEAVMEHMLSILKDHIQVITLMQFYT